MARTAISILGAGIGWAVTGGSPAGARWGYAAGAILGGMLYPPKAQGGPANIGALALSGAQRGQVLPVVYGRTRVPGSLIWYAVIDSGEGGKKGGPESPWRSMQFALCEGQATSLLNIYTNGGPLPLGEMDYEFYTGTASQTYSPTVASFKTAEQVNAGYRHVCHVLVHDTQVTGLTFEISRLTAAVAAGNSAIGTLGLDSYTENGDDDMNPVVCLADFLTHPRYGLGFAASDLHEASWKEEAGYAAYNNLYVSPVLDVESPSIQHIEHLLSYFDGILVWTQGQFKLHSRRSPVRDPALWYYNLYDTDWLEHPRFSVAPAPSVANTVAVEYRDRALTYDRAVVELADDWDVAARGEHRQAMSLPGVTTAAVAGRIVSKLLWSRIVSPFGVELKCGPEAIQFEPGELLKIRGGAAYAVEDQFVRIVTIEEQPDRTFIISGIEER